MRQTIRRGVAPLNPDPKWPQGYVAVLREAGAVEKAIPFLLTWVRRFFARYPDRNRRDLGRPEIEAFLGETSQRHAVSNWQIAQARDALELYYEQFRGIALAPRPDDRVVAIPPAPPPTCLKTVESYHAPDAARKAVSPRAVLPQAVLHPRPTENGAGLARAPETVQVTPRAARETRSEADSIAPLRAAVGSDGSGSRSSTAARTNWSLLDARVRECLRVAHYSYRTEQTYVGWIRNFLVFHQWRKPSTMDAGHVRDFLRHLAMERQVASSTQNQALNAVVYLFKSVLKKDLGDFSDFQRARRGLRLPIVASRAEVKAVIGRMSGRERFMAVLLYGTGMRINELLSLRVQDVDYDQNRLVVRGGKGDKDRYVPFPEKYREQMQQWLKLRQEQYQADKEHNMHEVELPCALAQKYPNAPWEWRWQYVFAADDYSEDPRSGHIRRHHVDEQHLQRAVRDAVKAAGLTIRFTPHCFRHYAEHLIMPSSRRLAA